MPFLDDSEFVEGSNKADDGENDEDNACYLVDTIQPSDIESVAEHIHDIDDDGPPNEGSCHDEDDSANVFQKGGLFRDEREFSKKGDEKEDDKRVGDGQTEGGEEILYVILVCPVVLFLLRQVSGRIVPEGMDSENDDDNGSDNGECELISLDEIDDDGHTKDGDDGVHQIG